MFPENWFHWLNRFLQPGAERRDHAEGLSDRGGRAAEAAPGKLQPAAASAPVAGAWSSKNGDDGLILVDSPSPRSPKL